MSNQRRVLVTGADGFIGSHLTERLQADGHEVRALCNYNSNGSLGWLDTVESLAGIDPVLGDIRDSGQVAELCEGVDTVYHLAALISIPYSYQAPRAYVDTNVHGTINVLDGALRHGVRRVVHTSTSEVYGTPATVPISESHALQGQSPYSASKIAADKMAESYAKSFECPVVTLRPFNTYGPRQSLRAVIPAVLRQLLSGADQISLGSLTPRRDFTFVSDTVDGFVRIADADVAAGEVIHLGTGSAVSIGELVDICKRVTGSSAEVISVKERIRPEASEVLELLSDPSLAQERLGWKASVSIEQGLAAMAQWIEAAGLTDDASRYLR